MKKNSHYLIEIPPRCNGIYIIMNLVKKEAYVGLAKNLATRTLDHFQAICCTADGSDQVQKYRFDLNETVSSAALDNAKLLAEEERNFLHIPIYVKNDRIDDTRLKNIESMYICMVRDIGGFEMYNIMKRGWARREIVANGISEEEYDPLHAELMASLDARLTELTGRTLAQLGQLSRADREKIWLKLTHSFTENGDGFFTLKKAEGARYSDCRAYRKIARRLDSFCISKEKLESLGIDLPQKSIFDPALTPQLNNILISNFGTHNGESPYEILMKKTMDIQDSSDGCTYWAFKKQPDDAVIKDISRLTNMGERADIYLLFKTTPHDNSNSLKPRPDLESTKAREVILAENESNLRENGADLKHSYWTYDEAAEQRQWKLFPKELCSVTSPDLLSGGKEAKSVAFRINGLWLCEEYIDLNMLKENRMFETPTMTGSGKTGPQPVYFGRFLDKFFAEKESFAREDESQLLIARLAYPYIVPVSHLASLETYLDCREDGKTAPRVILETSGGKPGKNTQVKTLIVLCREGDDRRAWVCSCESLTLGDFERISDPDLLSKCAALVSEGEAGCYEGRFTLKPRTESAPAAIKVTADDQKPITIRLDTDGTQLDGKKALYHSERGKPAYYPFYQEDGTVYSFRYQQKKTGDLFKPPFLIE